MGRAKLTLLSIMWPNGTEQLQEIRKSEFVRIHDNYPGGDDVAYLESC